jgi:uncharacterized protein (UPF0548 family)
MRDRAAPAEARYCLEVLMTAPDHVAYPMETIDWVPCRPVYSVEEDNCEIIFYCTTLKEVIQVYESLAIMHHVECVSTYKKRAGGRYGETLWEWLE